LNIRAESDNEELVGWDRSHTLTKLWKLAKAAVAAEYETEAVATVSAEGSDGEALLKGAQAVFASWEWWHRWSPHLQRETFPPSSLPSIIPRNLDCYDIQKRLVQSTSPPWATIAPVTSPLSSKKPIIPDIYRIRTV
jgi:hypothetical protein